MTPEQTQQYVNVTIAFLNRANLTGQEAETMAEVKRWLVSLATPPVAPPIPTPVEN